MIDDHRAVLFGGLGGIQAPGPRSTKEVFILDLTGMVCVLFDKVLPPYLHSLNGITAAPVPVAWHGETIV